MTDASERTERITIRVSTKELAMLQTLSEATCLTISDVVRQLIRERFSKLEAKANP